MTDVHTLDQLFAGADDYLTQFVAKFEETSAEYGEDQNMLMLASAASDLGDDLVPLFVAAVRRLAKLRS